MRLDKDLGFSHGWHLWPAWQYDDDDDDDDNDDDDDDNDDNDDDYICFRFLTITHLKIIFKAWNQKTSYFYAKTHIFC